MSARYTFFELATQKGHIMATFAELLPRHWIRGCTSTPDGNSFLFEAKKYDYETQPQISLTISGRGLRESTAMWTVRAREEAHKAWEAYVRERADRTIARQRMYGVDGTDGEAASKLALAQLAKIEDEKKAAALLAATRASLTPASSTPLPTESAPSPSATSAEVGGSSVSAPSGPTETESASTPTSTASSSKTLKRTGSKSRSSSGRSTASSTSATGPVGSTSPDA